MYPQQLGGDFGPVNSVGAGSIYPGASQTASGAAAAGSAWRAVPGMDSTQVESTGSGELDRAVAIGATGNPFLALMGVVLLLVGVMFLSQRYGSEGETFGHIKLGAYNILIISLAAIPGIFVWKTLFTKVPVPGVSTVVLGV